MSMPPPLSESEFAMQVGQNMSAFYQSYLAAYQQALAAQSNPFPLSSKPLAAPDSAIEKSGDTLAGVESRVEALEVATGQEKLGLAIGGVAFSLFAAYTGIPKP